MISAGSRRSSGPSSHAPHIASIGNDPEPDGVHVRRTVERVGVVVRRIDYPPGYRQPPHSHDVGSVTLLLGGRILESARGGEELGTALSVVVKPPGVRHEDHVGARGARTLQVAFEPEATPRLAADDELRRWRWIHRPSASRALLGLVQLLEGPTDPPTSTLDERILEGVAALAPLTSATKDPPRWLARAKEALDDRLERGVELQELADEAGVHPGSLSRAFRRHYGRSVSRYRHEERARRAAGYLASTGESISRLAYRAGYADHAHLSRGFRRLTGMTPSEFRRVAGNG